MECNGPEIYTYPNHALTNMKSPHTLIDEKCEQNRVSQTNHSPLYAN